QTTTQSTTISPTRRSSDLLIVDEMITGFRWHPGGAAALYGVTPDLSTFGKGIGNGFSVAALVGRRELMERGGLRTDQERVFLLSDRKSTRLNSSHVKISYA